MSTIVDTPPPVRRGRVRRVVGRIFKRPQNRNPEAHMSVLEHLDEFRYRLVWMVSSIAVAGVAGWIWFDSVVGLLMKPASPYLKGIARGKLIFTGPLEVFILRLKVAVFVGIGIALPLILFHFWRFVAPALKPRERRYAFPFAASGTILFGIGLVFAYVTLPQALQFLIGPAISGRYIDPLLSGKQYLDFMLLYMIGFGLSFEFPLVVMALSLARIVSSRQMARYRRHVFCGIALIVAVATPSVDFYSMTVLTLALYVMFESCIWLSRLLKR
jgi:sec-independent protein translocase protein TatC